MEVKRAFLEQKSENNTLFCANGGWCLFLYQWSAGGPDTAAAGLAGQEGAGNKHHPASCAGCFEG